MQECRDCKRPVLNQTYCRDCDEAHTRRRLRDEAAAFDSGLFHTVPGCDNAYRKKATTSERYR